MGIATRQRAGRPLRILCDTDIPFAAQAFGRYGVVRLLPGCEIDRAASRDADVLIIRSVTRMDDALLEGTPVRFVGTPTSGTDHLDLASLGNSLRVASAPGCNAESVVEWVIAALLLLAVERSEGLAGKTLGIIGCGHVGGRLLPRAEALGLRVIACDPPLAAAAAQRREVHRFLPYERVLDEADILTFHTPLTLTGPHRTHHLLDRQALRILKPGAWVLNASRGAVIDEAVLIDALDAGHIAAAALDVWKGEPTPDPELVRRALIATPHVAGHNYDAKVLGSRLIEEALREWLVEDGNQVPRPFDWDAVSLPATLVIDAPPAVLSPPLDASLAQARWLDQVARSAYDLRADDAHLRASALADPAASLEQRTDAFSTLRQTYPRRRSWERFLVSGVALHDEAVTQALCMRLGPAPCP